MSFNPYRPPTAPVADLVTDELHGRPVLVSVVAIYYGCTAILSIVLRYFFVTHLNLLPASVRAQFQSLNWADYGMWGIMIIVKMWAAIWVFRLKENALVPFVLLFSLAIINTLRHIFFKNWLAVTPGPALVSAAVGFLLSICILLYVAGLRADGVLRSTRKPRVAQPYR